VINYLYLPICLRMISTAKVQLSSHPSPQTLLETTHEFDIPIRSGGPRNVMQTKYLI